MEQRKYFLILILFSTQLLGLYATVHAQIQDRDSSSSRLFYVERSKNKNIVCYDANTLAGGGLDVDNPVNVYWINREERPGERNGLNVIQRRLAFGYKVLGKDGSVVRIALNACKDRPIEIVKEGSKFVSITNINQKRSTLVKVYVKTQESNSLSVEYIELTGVSLDSGSSVTERITQ